MPDIRISDAGLASLQGLTRLQELDLSNATVTAGGLRHLRGWSELQKLWLADTPLTDAGLEEFRSVPKLSWLVLAKTGITDSGLAVLSDARQLTFLDLTGTRITDAGLAHLRGLTLNGLKLGETQITDAGLAHLRGQKALMHLDLSRTQVTDEGLKNLAEFKDLEYIALTGSRVTGPGLIHLVKLDRLQSIDMTDAQADWAAVRRFKQERPEVHLPSMVAWGWDNPARTTEVRITPGIRKILVALEDDTRLEFSETPLAAVADFLSDQHDIPVRLDEPQLRAAGLSPNVPVTRNLKRVTLHSALRLILGQLGLTYVIRDEAVVITTAEEGRRSAHQGIIHADEVKREFEKRAVFRRAKEKISSALREITQLEFIGTPLADIVVFLRDQHDIAIEFDERGLAAVGVKTDVRCTQNLKGVSLDQALTKLLGELGLTHAIDDEVLLITPAKKAAPAEKSGKAKSISAA